MAFQSGQIKLVGKIGDLSFYKTKNHDYQVRERVGVTAARIASDPNYIRTRENNSEFGRASIAAKALRNTFSPLIGKNKDETSCSRLVGIMQQIIKLDPANVRGKRVVTDKETAILKSFEFNLNGRVRETVFTSYRGIIDRTVGTLSIHIPSFVPSKEINAPVGATHFKFKAGGAVFDFEARSSALAVDESEVIAYGTMAQPGMVLSCKLTPGLQKPLMLVFGVDFYQRVNGTDHLLNNSLRSGLCVVEVDACDSGGALAV